VLDDVVRRIVEVAAPEKIILFGSAARGELGPNSDIDLLVIKGGEYDPGRLAEQIYLRLHGAAAAVDVIVVTPEEVGAVQGQLLPGHLPRAAGGHGGLCRVSGSPRTIRGSGSTARRAP